MIGEEVANSKKNEKRKREYVDTYNDLQVAKMADSEDDEQSAYKTLVKGGFHKKKHSKRKQTLKVHISDHQA